MTDKKEKIKEIKAENDKVTMETSGIDYKKVSSHKHQCEKMIGAGAVLAPIFIINLVWFDDK